MKRSFALTWILTSVLLGWVPMLRAQDTPPDSTEVQPPPVAEQPATETAPEEKPAGEPAAPTEEANPNEPKSSDGFDPNRAVVKPAVVVEEAKPEPAKPQPAPSAKPKPLNVPKPKSNGNPEKDLFEHAELLFKHEYWYLARQQYQKYLSSYSRGPNAQASYYKIAECYAKLQDPGRADVTYEQLLRLFSTGPYVGAAAYRLADVRYKAGDFQRAMPYFALAEQKAEKEVVRISAGYYRARCLHQLNAVRGAEDAYRKVASNTSESPDIMLYRDASLLALARMEVANGHNAEALEKFVRLTAPTTSPRVRAEALAKAGVLSQDLGQGEQAVGYFQEVLREVNNETEPWQSMALAGLLTNYYKQEKFRELLDVYQRHRVDFSRDERGGSVLLVVAHAYRRLGEYGRAAGLYDGIERGFPNSPEAQEASYRKLLCMHKANDSQVGYQVEEYLKKHRLHGTQDQPFYHMAMLLKAEALFAEGQRQAGLKRDKDAESTFAQAAEAYLEVRTDKVPEKYHSSVYFKRGWSLMEAHRYDKAVESFNEFIAKNADSDLSIQAMAKRAECYTKMKLYDMAAKDCDELMAKNPDHAIAHHVLQRRALIEVERRDPAGIVKAFRALLEKYPDTRGAAEAHFFIGKALQDQNNYKEAIPELKKARQLDPGAYQEHATSGIIFCYHNLSQVDDMAKEADILLGNDPKSSRVSPKLLSWLGGEFYKREEYERAARYLYCIANYEKPAETRLEVWNILGNSLLKSGKFQDSIAPFNHCLADDSVKSNTDLKAKILLNKASALAKTSQYKEAQACAEEAVSLQNEGRVNGQAQLLLGDIAFAQKDFDLASKYYAVTAALFDDKDLTPEALEKAARCFEQLGDAQKAADKRRDLRRKYPQFQGLKP